MNTLGFKRVFADIWRYADSDHGVKDGQWICCKDAAMHAAILLAIHGVQREQLSVTHADTFNRLTACGFQRSHSYSAFNGSINYDDGVVRIGLQYGPDWRFWLVALDETILQFAPQIKVDGRTEHKMSWRRYNIDDAACMLNELPKGPGGHAAAIYAEREAMRGELADPALSPRGFLAMLARSTKLLQ